MKKISSKRILLVILAIFIVAISWRFFNLLSFRDSSIVLQKGKMVKLHTQKSLSHNFTASRDGLTKVEVLLRSPGIKYENGDRMKMELLDENCEKKIREGYLTDAFLDSNNLFEFKFERIPDSGGKNYCLKATFDNQKENAKAIQFYTMGEEENQPYSIRPVYKNSNVFGDLSELNRRISQYKPWFLKHYYLWFVMIGFIVLSVSLVVIMVLL